MGSNEDKVGIGGFDEDITVEWTVSNVGGSSTGGSFNYEIRLSSDFVLGSDIILPIQSDDRPSDGVISSMNAGTSTDVSTTFRITKAQASSLLGIPTGTITVQDLVDNDVFLLVHFDSDEDILEHEETNIIPIQASRLVDVALVMDRSGSMGSSVPVSNGSQTKLAQLKKAANLFLDLMRTNNGDRIGEVSFSSTERIDFDEPGATERVTPLTSGASSNLAQAKQAVDNLNAGGGTNIRDALQQGLDLLPAGVDRRKVVVFLSDGMKTAGGDPQQPSFLQQFTDQNVNVFSVGFGTEGGGGCSGIDVDLLSSLANTGASGFFQVAENATQLDKFFINALGGAIESELVVDPEGTIAPGRTILVDAGLGTQDRAASFILTWDDPNVNLSLMLRSPSGLMIHEGNTASFGSKVTLVRETGYAFIKVKPPLPTGPATEHGGHWEMIIHNGTNLSTRYLANVLADSTINLTLATPPPVGESSFSSGQPIGMNAAFTHTGGSLSNTLMTVFPSVPGAGLGDVLSSKLIGPEDLAKVPETGGDERLSLLQRPRMAFEQKYGRPPVAKREEASFPLDFADQAQSTAHFTGMFPSTTPGEYCFVLRADAHDDDCDPVQREILRTIRVRPGVDPKMTRIDVDSTPPNHQIIFTPRGGLGHFIGPGHSAGIVVATDGVDQNGPVTDNLDGSYGVSVIGASAGMVQISVLGVALPLIQIEPGIPVPELVIPSGGTNDVPTQATIFAKYDGVDGESYKVILLGGDQPVVFDDVQVNQGEMALTVPAGLAPGNYRLQLGIGDRLGSPSKELFRVIGRGVDFPVLVGNLGGIVDQLVGGSVSQKLANQLLGDLLIVLLDAPLGTSYTTEQQKAASLEVSQLLAMGDGMFGKTDLLNVLDAFERLTVDSRDASRGAVNTPKGTSVEVDLSHQVKLMFDRVNDEGESEVKLLTGPTVFRNGSLGKVPAIFDITSTAKFGAEGIMIEINYEEGDFSNEAALILAHRKDKLWTDITTGRDPVTNKIQGLTPSLSEFAVIEILPGQEVGEITGDRTPEGPIEIEMPAGRFYDAQFSRDLKVWTTIAEGVSGTFTDSNTERTDGGRVFYQVILNEAGN